MIPKYFKRSSSRLLAAIALSVLYIPAAIAQAFTVADIRLEGLQRISATAVFGLLIMGDRVEYETVGRTFFFAFYIGLAVATFYLLLDLGTGIGPLLLGAVVGTWDYRVMYLASAALVVVIAVHYTLVHGRHAGRARR